MMKKQLLIIGLLLLFSFGDGLAQEEKQNSLTLNWGVGTLKRQDINFSPMVFTTTSAFNLGLTYEHLGNIYHRVYTRFGRYKDWVGEGSYNYLVDWSGEWETTELLPHSFNILDLNYTFGFRTVNNNKLIFFVGGQVRNLLNQGDFEYGNHAIGYYNFSFGLDAWTALNYSISQKHQLGAELSLPLFAWVTKSPYLGQNDEYFDNVKDPNVLTTLGNYLQDGQFESWGEMQRVDLHFRYRYQLSNKWSLMATYALNISSFDSPARYRSIENTLLIGANIKL